MKQSMIKTVVFVLALGMVAQSASARDLEYKNEEVQINVTPGEPTQLKFPGEVQSGFKRKKSALSVDKRGTDLVVFASEALPKSGEAVIVRLEDGRSYSIRVVRSSDDEPRDSMVNIVDKREAAFVSDEEDLPYKEKNFERSPENSVAGLMREMMLVAEFGKGTVTGYRISDQYKGETVLNDGTLQATIDRIFIGSNLWGYVIDAQNLVGQSQKLNPASFRLDGTRAISAVRWELAAQPINVEQQVAGAHKTKVYVITRPQQKTALNN